MPQVQITRINNASNRYLTNRQLKQKNATLEGVVVNNFIKDNTTTQECANLNDTYNTLVISDEESENVQKYIGGEKDKGYNAKKALLPLALSTGAIFASGAILSFLFKKSAKKNLTEPFIKKLPSMGMNINIVEETGFATYIALRDPNRQNIMATIAVFAFSALTLTAKKFVEGVKEIWVKKQDAQVQKELQENLIDVETRAFSGKLAIQRNMLSQHGNYFKKALETQSNMENDPTAIYFKNFNFKGLDKTSEQNKDKKLKDLLTPNALISAGLLAGSIALGVFTLKNIKAGAKYHEDFINNFKNTKQKILDEIIQNKTKDKTLLTDTLIKMGANSQKAKECAEKAGFGEMEVNEIIQTVSSNVENIWGNAPTGMSTENGKAFFYCYLNETRGHLYNWLIHNDNPFLKNLFIAMAAVSSTSFLAQQTAEAIKEATVIKENAKTELDLQKRLVEVEINNFKAKKESAIAPLIEEFERKKKEGKPANELKVMADNILLEIKNGPPFVYS